MSEMVERVARAMLRAEWKETGVFFDRRWELLSDVYLTLACAALEELRVTPECIAKINGSVNWPKMIDAILTPSPAALNPQSQP